MLSIEVTPIIPTTAEVPGESSPVQVRIAAYDAYRVFNDLCLLIEDQRPQFLKVITLPQTFSLELIESVLVNHASIFVTHDEQSNLLRSRVMPFIVNALSEKNTFGETVRIIRIFFTLIREYLALVAAEAEMALGLLVHILDTDTVVWKRALCMEVLRGLFDDVRLVFQIYEFYDAQAGRKDILTSIMATFVRLINEKPALLGLAAQSTIPSQANSNSDPEPNDQAMLEATGVPVIISNPSSSGQASVGIGTQWSIMKIPCIDQLDKADAPLIPETYVYNLVLICISGFAEGIARFVSPLTVLRDVQRQEVSPEHQIVPKGQDRALGSVPVNLLILKSNSVGTCAAIMEHCWPAILATCSTFFHAALDNDSYRTLVRSFQRFTHVAGLLKLSTPRDAFLTALSKVAMPPGVVSVLSGQSTPFSLPRDLSHSVSEDGRSCLTNDESTATFDRRRPTSISDSSTPLSTRNMLCLRALLNLGIALGPTLDRAWLIVLECLQQADLVLSSSIGWKRLSNSANSSSDNQEVEDMKLLANFGLEVKAVESAVSRLFESTTIFPDDSFRDIVNALCMLPGGGKTKQIANRITSPPISPSLTKKESHARRSPQVSFKTSVAQSQEDLFVLSKISDIASLNIKRLLVSAPENSGWTVLTKELVGTITSNHNSISRMQASHVLVEMIAKVAHASATLPYPDKVIVHRRLLNEFMTALDTLSSQTESRSISSTSTEIDIHKIVLEGFKNMLESSGELASAWDIAFRIIGSVFIHKPEHAANSNMVLLGKHQSSRSPKLVKSAFNSLQLICSDFLTAIPNECFAVLTDTLYNFCAQDDDINICLTVRTPATTPGQGANGTLGSNILLGPLGFLIQSSRDRDTCDGTWYCQGH